MIKLVKNFETFDEAMTTLADLNINDRIIDEMLNDQVSDEGKPFKYVDMVRYLTNVIAQSPPGFFNPEYPNCPSLNVTNSFITYSHNGIGFGVNVNIRQDIAYTLSILFYNNKNIIVHNPIYADCIRAGFEEKVMGKKPSIQ